MKSELKRVLLLLFLLPVSGYLWPQEKDAGLWLAAEGTVQVRQRSFILLNTEVRMHENMTEAGTFLAETGFGHDFGKGWRIAAYYRFIARQQLDRSYHYRHRYYSDLRYRYRTGKTDWIARARVQQQLRHEELLYQGNTDDRTYLRLKGTFRYRINRTWRPYVGAEFYFPLTISGIHQMDKMRFSAGTLYRINRVHTLNFYYMIQHQVNVINPETDYIVGIGYEFTPKWKP